MSVNITLTFTDAEIDELIADGYTHLKLYRSSWWPGVIGSYFAYALATYSWAIVDGTTSYTLEDTAGHADSEYVWAPYSVANGLGPVRPAFEPDCVRMVSLLAALGQVVDPSRFVYSKLTGATDADTLLDTTLTEPDDFYNNLYLLLLSGDYKREWRQVGDWAQSGGTWTLARVLTGTPAATNEYLVLPFKPDAAFAAVRQAVAEQWPKRGRRVEDESVLTTASVEQVYTTPAPIEIIERVEYLPSTESALPVPLSFRDNGHGEFFLDGGTPTEGSTLRVTGLARFSSLVELDSVTNIRHPADTGGVLARAEMILRGNPSSGLDMDAQRMNFLAARMAEEDARLRTVREIPIHQAIA